MNSGCHAGWNMISPGRKTSYAEYVWEKEQIKTASLTTRSRLIPGASAGADKRLQRLKQPLGSTQLKASSKYMIKGNFPK